MTEFSDPERKNTATQDKLGRLGDGARLLGRQALAILGLILVILSFPIGFLTPFLPIGLPVGVFGGALLARNSVWGERFVGYLVNRFPAVERISPNWLVKLVLGREKHSDF